MGFLDRFHQRYEETRESVQNARDSLNNTKEIIKDPVGSAKEAGANWIDGVIDRAAERFMDWFTQAIDNLALGGMMVGCFLYMLGIQKGGQASWLILAVWFTIKVFFWSTGANL